MAGENLNPFTASFWQWVHQEFYGHLPAESLQVTSREGQRLQIYPGRLRTREVQVGRQIAPSSAHLSAFIQRFKAQYNPEREVAWAAAHHRLAWIHSFLDGNGRVIRLFSDAGFMREGLDAGGLWSMSRWLVFVNLMVVRKEMRSDARYILESLFLKGEITKIEAYRLTGLSVKTAMTVTSSLAKLGLLSSEGNEHFSTYQAAYSLIFPPILFYGLYPEDKEVDMMTKLPG